MKPPYLPPPPRMDLIWIAVDFDKTIAYSAPPDFVPTDIMNDAKRKLEELRAHKWKIVVHTARPWAEYETIESWLDYFEIPYDRIQCGKLLAKMYIDDRNGPHVTADSWLPEDKDAQKEQQRAARKASSDQAPSEPIADAFSRLFR